MRSSRTLLVAFLLASLTGCVVSTTTAPPSAMHDTPVATTPACNPGQSLLNATLWMQTSAERQALARQTYGVARRMLDAAIADHSWSALGQGSEAAALPPAIILDLDETTIDNMSFESRMIDAGTTYSSDLWNQWVSESAARAMPGAPEFLAYAKSRGVTPFYVTNRKTSEKPATRANLVKLGYPIDPSVDTLLFEGDRPGWSLGKSSRREFIASTHRVLMLFGDDLNDFAAAAGKPLAERDAIVNQHQDDWGTKWFILPNPVYGSWERATMAGAPGNTDCEKKSGMLRR
jgi:5'-nucleotidase (lipoprotein e(P4) family)